MSDISDYFEMARQNDHMELINDINEIGVYPLTLQAGKSSNNICRKNRKLWINEKIADGMDKERNIKNWALWQLFVSQMIISIRGKD